MSKLATDAQNQEIGARLAALRGSVGLSQIEFAQRLSLSPRAYQNYERGEREVPAVVLKAIYTEFGADPLWVLVGPGTEPVAVRRDDGADLLERIVVAVEQRLAETRHRLEPEKKGRLVKLIYQHFRHKATFDLKHVNEMLAIAG